jgi:hypothetical protein
MRFRIIIRTFSSKLVRVFSIHSFDFPTNLVVNFVLVVGITLSVAFWLRVRQID